MSVHPFCSIPFIFCSSSLFRTSLFSPFLSPPPSLYLSLEKRHTESNFFGTKRNTRPLTSFVLFFKFATCRRSETRETEFRISRIHPAAAERVLRVSLLANCRGRRGRAGAKRIAALIHHSASPLLFLSCRLFSRIICHDSFRCSSSPPP